MGPLRSCCVLVLTAVLLLAGAHPTGASGAQDHSEVQDPVSGDLNRDGAARVVAVGDSIMQGAAPRIEEAFRSAGYEVAVDTAVSRSTLAGVDLVRFYTAMGADAVVVMLGANDAGNPETFRTRVRSVIDAAQGAPLLAWVTIPEVRDYYPAANEVLRQEMSARTSGSVLEWSPLAAAPGVTASDGLHLTPTGIETMSGFLVASVVAAIEGAQSEVAASGPAGETSPADSPDRDDDPAPSAMTAAGTTAPGGDVRGAPGVADSFKSLIGPGGLAVAAVLMAAALVCGGVGVALWSLWRTRAPRSQT
ncbi:MAG: hypothetical protein M5U19_02765 [Microthrixaceae bacterium]|nr:hypothetical protein [Microthrixaceae bacterium]